MNTSVRSVFFALLFCLTGVGTALLGATLPAILHNWQLTDARGGFLLLAAWAGSTSGPLFVRDAPQRSVAVGMALSAFALFASPWASALWLPLFYAVYGLGLGLSMTAISLIRGRNVAPAQANVALNQLNLLWAAGAFCAPAIALHSLRALSITGLFRTGGGVLTLAALGALALVSFPPAPSAHAHPLPPSPLLTRPTPLHLCLFAAAAVGMESGIGSWLTTYAERVTHGVGTAVSANTAFWAGLLVSRAAHSFSPAGVLHRIAARVAHIAAAGGAVLLLILFPFPGLLPLAGLVCGLGLGPLYPFVLSIALPRFRSTAVFVLAGVGASVVPWLTGALSSASGSLRIGLLAPAFAFALLATAAIRMRAELRGTIPA